MKPLSNYNDAMIKIMTKAAENGITDMAQAITLFGGLDMSQNLVEFKDLASGLVELSREYVGKLVLYRGDHIAEVAEFDRQLTAGQLGADVVKNGVTWSLGKYTGLSSTAFDVFCGAVFVLTEKVLKFGLSSKWKLPPEPSAREQMGDLNDAKELYLDNIQLLVCGWRLPNDAFEGRLKSLVETRNEILDMLNRAEDVATGRDCEE